jgi:hypothetical protein
MRAKLVKAFTVSREFEPCMYAWITYTVKVAAGANMKGIFAIAVRNAPS